MLSFKLYCESKEEFYTKIKYIPEEGYDIWNTKEIDDIKKWFNENVKKYHITAPSGKIAIISIHGDDFNINIYKLKDEWWIINAFLDWIDEGKRVVWKCDQWEGLIELLSDIFNKQINESLEIEPYYYPITPKEYSKLHSTAKKIISDKSIKDILDHLKEIGVMDGCSGFKNLMYGFYFRYHVSSKSCNNNSPSHTHDHKCFESGKSFDIIISECDDEWWLVRFYGISGNGPNVTVYFKCDQFDGLLDFLSKVFFTQIDLLIRFID